MSSSPQLPALARATTDCQTASCSMLPISWGDAPPLPLQAEPARALPVETAVELQGELWAAMEQLLNAQPNATAQATSVAPLRPAMTASETTSWQASPFQTIPTLQSSQPARCKQLQRRPAVTRDPRLSSSRRSLLPKGLGKGKEMGLGMGKGMRMASPIFPPSAANLQSTNQVNTSSPSMQPRSRKRRSANSSNSSTLHVATANQPAQAIASVLVSPISMAQQTSMQSSVSLPSAHALPAKILLIDPLEYIAETFDKVLAPTIHADSPLKQHVLIYLHRKMILDLARSEITSSSPLSITDLATLALTCFARAGLV